MKNIRRFAIASVALALGLPAAAQSTDTATPSTTSARPSVAPAPAYTTHQSGSSKAVLRAFGPYITQSNVGANGADVSELYTMAGYTVYGYNMASAAPGLCADDFTVPAGQTWTVSNFKWLSYQTGAPTTGTHTSMNLNLWSTNPTGQLPGGQSTTGGNQYSSKVWTGVNRVLDTNLLASDRVLIEVNCNGAWAPPLGAGTYWLEASAAGTLSSGPWAPVEVSPGQVPGQNPQRNGVQSFTNAAFVAVIDNTDPQGFLFQVEGTGGGGGVGTFCTSKPSSLPSCTPTLSAGAATVNKNGTGTNNLVASPVPGGAGKPAILIYSKTGLLGTPINSAFGFICIPVTRLGAFPAVPGGTAGVCDGAYTFGLPTIVNATPGIAAGNSLHLQCWYRDPANPGGANMTNGVGPIAVL